MKKILTLALLALTVTAYAQDPALETIAKNPDIQKELSSPDGVAIARSEDGSWKIFARGTATYDFNDPDEIRGAREIAQLRAKAALAKFLEEKVTASNAVDTLAKKTKNIAVNGDTQQVAIQKEDVTVLTESIRSYAELILTGVITLSEEKVPYSNISGEIQITIGQSSKTLQAAKEIRQGIKASLDDSAPAPSPAAPVPTPVKPAKENKYYFRHSNTEF